MRRTSFASLASLRRPAALLVVVACLAPLLGACGEKDEFDQEVRRAIARTQRLARRFVYTDERAERTISVAGLVQDDFRYKARIQFDGVDALDEVVSDDILAVRFIDPTKVADFIDKDRLEANTATELEGVAAPAVLQSRRWLLDENAAPSPTAGSGEEDELGQNPVVDALSALDYVRRAVLQAQRVKKWDADQLEPAYSRTEDSFAKPDPKSGVTRFDLVRPPFPPPGANASGQPALPETRHFRKMAIFVKDDRIIQVQEKVEAVGKFVERFQRFTRATLREADVPTEVLDQYDELVKRAKSDDELGKSLLQFSNIMLSTIGADRILVREMTLDLRDLGKSTAVDLPTTEVVKGSLDALSISRAAELAAARGDADRAPGSGAAGAGPSPSPSQGATTSDGAPTEHTTPTTAPPG